MVTNAHLLHICDHGVFFLTTMAFLLSSCYLEFACCSGNLTQPDKHSSAIFFLLLTTSFEGVVSNNIIRLRFTSSPMNPGYIHQKINADYNSGYRLRWRAIAAGFATTMSWVGNFSY